MGSMTWHCIASTTKANLKKKKKKLLVTTKPKDFVDQPTLLLLDMKKRFLRPEREDLC